MDITLFHISWITHENIYEAKGSGLIDTMYENFSFQIPPALGDELLEIGCDFQHSINEHFVENDGDKVFSFLG